MRVKCIKNYQDLQLKRLVTSGEELEVADARGIVLLKANVAEKILTTPEVATKPAKARKKKSES